MAKIPAIFLKLTGDLPAVIIRLILCFYDPGEFLTPLLTAVVSNKREYNDICSEEYYNPRV